MAAISRFLLSAIFIISGLSKIYFWTQTQSYMIEMGVPFAPFFLVGAIAVEVLAGFALLIGFRTKMIATLLFAYLIPTTLIFHRFWSLEGALQQIQFINFMKNLSIMGGLLHVSLFGAGSMSVDSYLERRAHETHKVNGKVTPLRKAI